MPMAEADADPAAVQAGRIDLPNLGAIACALGLAGLMGFGDITSERLGVGIAIGIALAIAWVVLASVSVRRGGGHMAPILCALVVGIALVRLLGAGLLAAFSTM